MKETNRAKLYKLCEEYAFYLRMKSSFYVLDPQDGCEVMDKMNETISWYEEMMLMTLQEE